MDQWKRVPYSPDVGSKRDCLIWRHDMLSIHIG